MIETQFFVGLDLGFVNDYSAVAILERRFQEDMEDFELYRRAYFDLTELKRFDLGTPYQQIIDDMKTLFENPKLIGKSKLLVDSTGVGLPITQQLEAYRLRPIPICITGGEKAVQSGAGWNVPRTHIISLLATVFQSARIKIAEGLELAKVFEKELQNIGYKIKKEDGAVTYESKKESVHDDLCMATGIALWYAARDGLEKRKKPHRRQTRSREYNPLWDD